MNNDTVMYIAVAAAVLAVIALIMICQVRSSLNPVSYTHLHQSAAPAAAAKKAAPAAASRAADNGAVVAAIAAAIVAMGGGEIVSIRPAARPGWTTGARIAGVSGNQQF